MADVASTTDDQKRAMLAAVAQQGSAGAATYQQYADSVAAQKQAAVQAAQQRSSLINAGPAADAKLTGSAVATSDPYAQDAATGATAYANENARLGTANSDYMDQVKAAIPLMAQAASAKISAAAAKKAAAKPAADDPLAVLIASLGGITAARAQLAPAAKQGVEDLQPGYDPIGAAMSTGAGEVNAGQTPEQVHQQDYNRRAIDTLAKALGIGPGVLQSFLGKESPDTYTPPKPAPLSVQNKTTRDQIHNDPTYKSTFSAAQKQINTYASQKDAKGHHVMSRTQAKAQVLSDLRNDSTYSSRQAIYDQIMKDLK